MKLKKLEIHNIASIENAVIDFEAAPLAESNVILITGETGAGKSTILDAICLALYANTPRMNNTGMSGKWQENDADEMDITDTMQLMRKNTNEAYVRLSFLGSDGNEYEAEWSVERKKKNLNRTWSLKNLTHPEASPKVGNGKRERKDDEIMEAIQTAVGLSFDQFCRTTMLAQGEFTRFLKSSKSEKAAILEKITNTEKYARIGAKVYDLTHRKYEKEMNEVDPSKKEQKPLPPNERADLEANRKAIEDKLTILNTQLDNGQKKVNWLSAEEKLLNNLNTAETAMRRAQDAMKTDEFKTKQQNLTDWDDTEDARKCLVAINDANETINNATQTILRLQTQYIRLLNGREYIRQKMDAVVGQIKNLDDEIKTEGGQPVSLEVLNAQKDDVLSLIGNIATAKLQVKNYFEKERKRGETQSKLDELKKEIGDKKSQYEILKPQVENAKKHYEVSETQYERLNLAVDTLAEKLRANLRVGKRCPVCGQQVQSLDSVPHEQELKEIVDSAKRSRDDAKKIFDDLNGQQNVCAVWLNQNIPLYNKDLQTFNEDHSLDKDLDDALLSLEKCNIKQLDEHTNDALKRVECEANAQKAAIEGKIARAKNRDNLQLTLDDLEKLRDLIAPLLNQLRQDVPDWQSLVAQKVEEIPDILAEMQSLSTKITTVLTNKRTASDTNLNNGKLLDDFLREHPNITASRLEVLLKHKDKIGLDRQFVQKVQDTLATAQGAVGTINGQIDEHRKAKPEFADGETINSLQTIIDELKNQIGALRSESGALGQQLKDDDERIEKNAEFKKEYDKRRLVFERWNRLDKLIGDAKGDKFRLIAQSYILAKLIETANVHMRTLTDRYTLQAVPGQELIILVEDAYQGGVKRPASTISGGESFLVSLALALALSEIGQSLKVETLFIDEGFGTLSGEPLIKAINTLESLHASNNRQVCAISHREEVKEKIPVQIQVNQNRQSSSSTIDVVLIS